MEGFRKTDTIAAIATGMTNSGVGIIRISGEEAFAIADRMFQSSHTQRKVSEMKTHTVHHGYIVYNSEILDEVLLIVMCAPHTYTCENVVEIQCHGGSLVMQKILSLAFQCGARPAEPGEFTKRAFLNGRIDLTQAESVIDLIQAKSSLALKSSVSQLQGTVSKKIKQLRTDLLYETAFMESAMDDPEHYSLDGYQEKLQEKVKEALIKIEQLLLSAENGRLIKDGIQTVIVGKPNAGKSSLLNALTGKERAIVTEIAGTTRDTLEEQIQIGGIGLQLIDTAGIRKTDDVVEKIGVLKSKECMEKADLILFVMDTSVEMDENDWEIFEQIKEKNVIILLNKSDLEQKFSIDEIKRILDKPVLTVSAKEEIGMEELEQTITEMFFHNQVSFDEEIYITNARQKYALEEAKESLLLVMNSINESMPEDFLTIDMMNAYAELGTVIGESIGEDLVNEIFGKFCMGK